MHKLAMGVHELIKLTMAKTWGRPPPSPLKYFLCLAIGATPKCHFPQDSQVRSLLEILEIGIPTTLEAHNFLCKPPIEVKFQAKL